MKEIWYNLGINANQGLEFCKIEQQEGWAGYILTSCLLYKAIALPALLHVEKKHLLNNSKIN